MQHLFLWIPPVQPDRFSSCFNLLLSYHLWKVTLVLHICQCFNCEKEKSKLWLVCDSSSIVNSGVEVQHFKVWSLPYNLPSLQQPLHFSLLYYFIGSPVGFIKAPNLRCRHFLPEYPFFVLFLFFLSMLKKPISIRCCYIAVISVLQQISL